MIDIRQFRSLAQAGKTGGVDGIRRTASGVEVEREVARADGSKVRSLTFTISDGSVDRQGDMISIDGWQLENYRNNPVVLWVHDSRSLPIAKATKLWKHAGKLKATAEFVREDMPVIGPLAEAVYQMYKGGFLSAASVGMRPLKWEFSKDPDRKTQYGIDFLEHELLEFSCVPIPANPSALVGSEQIHARIAAAVRQRQINLLRLTP